MFVYQIWFRKPGYNKAKKQKSSVEISEKLYELSAYR